MKKKFVNIILGFSTVFLFVACAPQHNSSMAGHTMNHQNMKMGSDIMVGEFWARATAKGQQTSAVYLHLHNRSQQTDYLLSATSDVAEKTEIHQVKMEDGMMTMRPVKQIEIAAGQMIELKPGGLHIMLIGLKKALTEGDRVAVTLTFKNAGKKFFEAPVTKMGQASMKGMRHDMKHEGQNMQGSGKMKM